jgi:hypothetical protein
MNQNYCEIKKNKIYAEIYDELLDEELSMNNKEHNEKIKTYIEKKILKSDFIKLSENFTTKNDIISDVIINITSDVQNENLQGNTVIMFGNDNEMYELFHMEDLTKSHSDDDLNEFGSISNIDLLPIYWGSGIFKSKYVDGVIKGDIITKQDVINLFIQNYYHKGVMIGLDGKMFELEFTGEDPFKVIGNNFIQSNTTDVVGFNIIPYIEKVDIEKSNILNEIGTKLLGREIHGRLFISLLCPTTNKKFWNITTTTVNNLLKILNNEEIINEIYKNIEPDDKYINPFYLLKKYLIKLKN